MRFHKSLKHAFGMVLHSRLRSWLTIIGIVIGVASVIAIMALGNGLKAEISSQLNSNGVDLLTVTAGASRGGFFGGGDFGRGGGGGSASTNNKTPVLTRADVQTLKGVSYVESVDTQISGRADITYLGQSGTANVEGVDPDVWAKMQQPSIASGRALGPSDTNVVLIGGRLASGYFDRPLDVNQMLTVEGRSFRVIGILNESSTSIVMPIQQAFTVIVDAKPNQYDRLVVKVRDPMEIANASAAMHEALALRRHTIQKPDFSISDPSAFLATRQQAITSLTTFLTAIAAVALLVGAIGIANTMFTSVLERTKQIGIMKAIGASRRDIMILFLLNAALIGLIGGVIGVIFGYILAQLMPAVLQIGPGRGGNAAAIVDLGTVAFALGISVLIGVVAGLIPAWNASKLKPVDALRYE